MLKGIPKILSLELLKVLCEMGHGDTICLADGNFPSESVGKNAIVIRADGHTVPALLEAVLALMPLDTYGDEPVKLMALTEGDKGKVKTPVWDEIQKIVADHDERGADAVGFVERFAFYEEAKKAYAVVATGETALYGNVLLRKGVVM